MKDEQYEEVLVAEVTPEGDGKGWSIKRDDGWSFFVPPESPVEPVVGMKARFYGKGIGYTVRGLFLNGQKVFYRTPEEQEEEGRRQRAADVRRRYAEFEKNKASMDRRYEALPEVFRRRIDKFRKNNPEFRWQYETYELFVCEQAVKIANTVLVRVGAEHREGDMKHETVAARAAEMLTAFRDATWEEQKRMVPDLDDGHSGNTFGASCALARLYLTQSEDVVRMHGALAPLVGSEEYGCVPKSA